MTKKTKLKLDQLKLNSFVTDVDRKFEETVKGGISSSPQALKSVRELCPSNLIACPTNRTVPTIGVPCW